MKEKASIQIQQEPLTEALKQEVYRGFSRHSIEMTGFDEKHEPIAFVANSNGTLVGAVVVEIFWGAFHVKYLYVHENHRGQDLGKRLMKEALSYGQANQCPFAFVETMSFQAPGFYQKMGFQIEFTRPGYAHGTSFHYLRKELRSSNTNARSLN